MGCGLLLFPGTAGATVTLNPYKGTYTDSLTNAQGLLPAGRIQAVTINPGGGVSIAPSWIWSLPYNTPVVPNPPVSTDMPFSQVGSATWLADTTPATACSTCFEDVHLLRTFFSAAQDMVYKNDCFNYKTQQPSSKGQPQCLIYPVPVLPLESTLGAQSPTNVLLVPDVAEFNKCQNDKTCQGSGDYNIVELHLPAAKYKDFLMSGQNYTATWLLRSPGEFPSPPVTPGSYNNRLTRFLISLSYSVNGSWKDPADYLGGATDGCSPPDIGAGCLNRGTGCGVRLLDTGAEAGGATLYLNDPADPDHGPYTPFAFNFTPGSTSGAPDPWHARGCDIQSLVNEGENQALCRTVPDAVWNFILTTRGDASPASPNTKSPCATTPGGVPCTNAAAAASLFIDGMVLTAGAGRYMSPPFDSLSPNTLWTSVTWDLDLSLTVTGGLPRTLVGLDLRQTNLSSTLVFSNTIYLASVQPAVEAGTFSLTWTGANQWFQFQARLSSWEQNLLFPPPPPAAPGPSPMPSPYAPTCLRAGMQYDGSLTPRVRRIAVTYVPDAGRIISNPIAPARLRRWSSLQYDAATGGGRIVADVLAVIDGPVLLADVPSGGSLLGIDPGQYPSIVVQFSLYRDGIPGADPRLNSFKVTYEPMTDCLSLNHNSIRLSRSEPVQIRFCTAKSGTVDVKVHDAAGQLVKKVFHGDLEAGVICQKSWNGRSDLGDAPATCGLGDTNPQGRPVAPGVFFVTVTTPGGRETARLAVSR